MKKLLIMLTGLLLVLTACSTVDKNSTSVATDKTKSNGIGIVLLGGLEYSDEQVHNLVYSDEVTTINYLVTARTTEYGLAANFIDTLVDYDKYGVLVPSLARDWSVSDDGLTWTFNLREGVNWYTHTGEVYAETVAQDFVDSLKYIFNSENVSKTASIAYNVLENAEAYYKGQITDFSEVGVKAIDKYTVEYTLKEPVPYFESMLSYVIFFPANGKFLEEQGDQFGSSKETLLYNGAYILEEYEPNNKRVLVANENYWDKENVHIKVVNYNYNKDASLVDQELFLKGEVSTIEIGSDSIDIWMADKTLKENVRPGTTGFYTYFYALNFDPQYDDAYVPKDWKIAVNNPDFRKVFFHGFDRIAALTIDEPYSPENRISNTITPANFLNYGENDFTNMSTLGEHVKNDTFNETLALEYKVKAMAALEGQVEFPIKVVMPYNTITTANAQKAQVIEEQLETLLGKDFIDVYIVPYPPTAYLNSTRRAGNYSFMEVNWGPDYADPHTYTEMFKPNSSYNMPDLSFERNEDDKLKYDVYHEMVEAASKENFDILKRYEMYAEAEAYLLDQAWVIPYRKGGGGYIASTLNPFDRSYSAFGVSSERWKGMKVLDKAMNTDLYLAEKIKWEAEREERLKD